MTAGPRWQVRVLGALSASDGQQTLTRFGGASVAALLARLAMYPRRTHAREELVELLWPGVELDVGRNRLRQALFALRTLLEPPAAIAQPVLIAERGSVRVHEGALGCDAVEFERAVREGRHADALALYAGELLPGYYDEWIVEERRRLTALAERAAEHAASPTRAPQPPQDHDPPAAARRERSTLPIYLTRFFGRADELAALRTALASHRLVTLLGPGGSGKTRLAVQFAAALRDAAAGAPRFEPLLFVPLAGCATRDALLDALLAALRLGGDGDRLDRLVEALADREALLLLDNFEQLVDVGADIIGRLAAGVPGLHLLVTSRRALGLDGERELLLPPLPAPPDGATLAEAAESPAVALFVDRARAARTDFHLGERNRAALAGLAEVLEGLPLAIELAASRIRSMSPAEMLAQLRPDGAGRPLELLARAGPDTRHASMRRAIEWSWRLLAPPQQQLLSALTAFETDFDAPAAAALAERDPAGIAWMLDELVQQSLLAVRPDAERNTRYALSALIRDYAATTLDAGAARTLRGRHRRWVRSWGENLPATTPLGEVRAHLRDLGAALASALADGEPEQGVALLVAWRRGLVDAVVPDALLAHADAALAATADPGLASRGHTLVARLHLAAGHGDAAHAHAERGLTLAREVAAVGGHDADTLLARALHGAASVAWRTVRQPARPLALLDEAEPHARRGGDPGLRASLLALRGFIANVAQRDLARAESLHAQALALWQQAGDAVSANNGRYNLAVCAMRAGRHADVLLQLAEVVAQARAQQDWRLIAQAYNVEGEAQCGLRDWPAAARAYRRSVELAWTALAVQPLAYGLWNLPHALARVRDPERAAQIGAAAARFWELHIGPLDDADRRQLRVLRRLVAVQIGSARTDAAWRAGAALGPAEAVALALGTTPAAST